ncbi:RNA 2',3'-cyclic phosphodiesterase [Cupriavidus campinensis]
MARLFIAIDTPPAVAAGLLHTLPVHRGVRPVPPGQLHLTLRFLGDQDEDCAARIGKALEAMQAPPLTMQVQGVGRFRGGQGAVLWAGLAHDDHLTALFDDIEAALADVGIARERRRFHPHLTVARCRPGLPEAVLRDWLAAQHDLTLPAWTADRFVLFESFLSPEGARHVPRAAYPLAAVAPGC